jgi:hypothetical protein
MSAWIRVFEYRIPWEALVENFTWLTAINGTLFLIAWLAFSQRDFKS